MNVSEPEQVLRKQSASGAARQPLVSAENKNGASHHPRTKELSSRHRSPTPSAAAGSKRCASPNARNASLPSTQSVPKRATSVGKARPYTISSTSSSTPVQEVSEGELFVRKQAGSRLPDSLWPSTMRSLSVSFQSGDHPIVKREKHVSSDRMLRISSNKQAEAHAFRKATPERKSNPLRGKSSADQLENSKPVDSFHPRLADQHRWPTRASGKVSNVLNKSVDLLDKSAKIPSSRTGPSSLRRLSLDGATKSLNKSSSDLLMRLSRDDTSLPVQKLGSSMSSDRLGLVNAAARALSSQTPAIRPQSPSVTRGNSPSQLGVGSSTKGPSPVRLRQPSPSRQSQVSTSVLSFIVDIKKGKKTANYFDDVHQLRMMYNRHLQWQYANAQVIASLQSQKVKTEKMLWCVGRLITDLRGSILKKGLILQQLNLKSKLFSILDHHLASLDDWDSIEKYHISNLSLAIQDLQSSTICLPVTASVRVEIESLKAALCSAVGVLQTIITSLRPILPRVEEMNPLLSEVADMSAHERAFLDECGTLLGGINTLQVEEYSHRSHLLQVKAGEDPCFYR